MGARSRAIRGGGGGGTHQAPSPKTQDTEHTWQAHLMTLDPFPGQRTTKHISCPNSTATLYAAPAGAARRAAAAARRASLSTGRAAAAAAAPRRCRLRVPGITISFRGVGGGGGRGLCIYVGGPTTRGTNSLCGTTVVAGRGPGGMRSPADLPRVSSGWGEAEGRRIALGRSRDPEMGTFARGGIPYCASG